MTGGRKSGSRLEPRRKSEHDPRGRGPGITIRDSGSGRQGGSGSEQPQGSRRRPSRTTRGQPAYKEPRALSDRSTSSDDDEEDAFRVEPRKRKGTYRESATESSSLGGQDFEQFDEETSSHSQPPPPFPLGQGNRSLRKPKIRRALVPDEVERTDYMRTGMTSVVRRLRREHPMTHQHQQYDYRVWTMFHLNFYSSVILSKSPPVTNVQWIDWAQIRECQRPSLDRCIEICQRIGAYEIMQFVRG